MSIYLSKEVFVYVLIPILSPLLIGLLMIPLNRKNNEGERKLNTNLLLFISFMLGLLISVSIYVVNNPNESKSSLLMVKDQSNTQATLENFSDEAIVENRLPEAGKMPDREYFQTGVGVRKTINLNVSDGYIGIIGGYLVDGKSEYLGVVGPGFHSFDITDGFALTIDRDHALSEWSFRVDLARNTHRSLDENAATIGKQELDKLLK